MDPNPALLNREEDIDDLLVNSHEEEVEEEIGQEEPTSLTHLTDAKLHPLQTLYMEYINDLPEYPKTHPNGYTYIIAADGLSQQEAEHRVQDIQYSRSSTHGLRNIKSTFLNCTVKKWSWKCTGALVCEYIKQSLRLLHHTQLDDEAWQEIRTTRKNIELIENDIQKRNAFNLYRSKKKFFQSGKACIDSLPTCAPIFKRSFYPDVNNEYHPYIGCVNESPGPLRKHYQSSVNGYTSIDLEFLEQLFNDSILPSQEECAVIKPLTTRQKCCDFGHIQGPGKLQHLKCSVLFTALVPVNIQATPYILFTSHGIHQHPPPPPHKPPEQIFKGIELIIKTMRKPRLNLTQFLRSPELEAFCQQYNASTPAEMHDSFSNTDRISAIIQKQRLLTYPQGQDLNGVIYISNINPSLKEYIQEKYQDPTGIMIICAYKEQMRLLSTLTSFEVDVSYKRIRQKNMNEIVFATYLPAHGKMISLLRVFTNQDTTDGYHLLFKRVFSVIQTALGQPIQFNSIHGAGILGLIMNMDTKQYTGLGRYLQEVDPLHRPILWQLQGILIFRRVHFFQTITETVGNQGQGIGVWSRMAGLIDCKSENDYDQLCASLIEHENPKVQAWAEHKKQPVIKAGLNKFCSNIPAFIYDSIRNHTTSAEQSHQKANASGKRLALTEAIEHSSKLDRQDILQYFNRTDFGVHHSYQTANVEANYQRHTAREESRKRQRLSSAYLSLSSPHDDNISTLRSVSQSRASDSNRSPSISSRGDRRISSRNQSFEQRRQALEIRELELRLREKEIQLKLAEEEIREKQLQNDAKEFELMERRARMRENM